MKKNASVLFITAIIIIIAGFLGLHAHAQTATTKGNLTFTPNVVKNGQTYTISLTGGPASSATRIFVDNADAQGFIDFQGWLSTDSSGNISVTRTLDCSSYATIRPGQMLPVGDRVLTQKAYFEYTTGPNIGARSSVATLQLDCVTGEGANTSPFTPVPSGTPGTGNNLFPHTVPSILNRNYVSKAPPVPTDFSLPLKRFVGRYFDGYPHGGQTTTMGFYWRSLAGGEPVEATNNRIYIRLRSTIAAYNKSSFIERFNTQPLSFFRGTLYAQRGYADAVLPWDAYFYPEEGATNGWIQEACDCNVNLHSFDVDDRGYLYLAHLFGVGIIRDDGTNLKPVSQIRGIKGLTFSDGPKTLPFFRNGSHGTNKITDAGGAGDVLGSSDKVVVLKSGTKYYLVSHDGPDAHILDVTDPLNPLYLRSASGEGRMNIVQAGQHVIVQGRESIKAYTIADYVAGLAPKKEFTSGGGMYTNLAVDKITGKAFSIHYSGRGARDVPLTVSLSVFTPSSSGPTEVKHKLEDSSVGGTSSPAFEFKSLEYNNGYLTAIGVVPDRTAEDVKIWVFKNGLPVELPTKDIFKKYYDADGVITNASVQSIGGKSYLFISTYEMADVYEIEPVAGASNPPPTNDGCAPGNKFSSITGMPCACVLNQRFKLGDKGEEVKAYQQVMWDAGFYRGRVDGTFGPISAAASLAYCRSIENPVYTPPPTTTPSANVPVITKIDGPREINKNQLGTWTAHATDPNNDDIAWSVDWGKGRSITFCKILGLTRAGQDWTWSASHSWPESGTYKVTFHVNDCKGGRAQSSFTVKVN